MPACRRFSATANGQRRLSRHSTESLTERMVAASTAASREPRAERRAATGGGGGAPPQCKRRMRIYGINPVVEALRAKRVTAIRVSPRTDERLTRILRLAEAQGIPVRRATADELHRLAGGARHHDHGVA